MEGLIPKRGDLALFFGAKGCTMWAVHVSLLMKMFSFTASLPQAVASTLGLGLSSDASAHTAPGGEDAKQRVEICTASFV